MKKFVFFSMLYTLLACTSIDPEPLPGIDPQPIPEPDPVVNCSYTVNGIVHNISRAAIYHDTGVGYNLVFSDGEAPLSDGYDKLNNRAYNLIEVDFAESALKAGNDMSLLSSDEWSFYVTIWDTETMSELYYEDPTSGNFNVSQTGQDLLSVSISLIFANGEICEIYYEGKVESADKYIWCEFNDGGNFIVDGYKTEVETVEVFFDEEKDGVNVALHSGKQVIVVDFPQSIIGGMRVVGQDSFNAYFPSGSLSWGFLSFVDFDGRIVTYRESHGDFQSGYFFCHKLSEEYISFDMSMLSKDGHQIDVHYHGAYSKSLDYFVPSPY